MIAESEVELSPGDIVLFPHGDPHCLSGGSGSNQIDAAASPIPAVPTETIKKD